MSDWLRAEALIAELRARIVELETRLGIHPEVEALIAATEPPEKVEPGAEPSTDAPV